MYTRRVFVACLCGHWLVALAFGADEPIRPGSLKYKATDYVSKTIDHSPQKPGYTCWTGTWRMPDKSLMITLTQATRPFKDRPRTDKRTLASFPGWPPNGLTALCIAGTVAAQPLELHAVPLAVKSPRLLSMDMDDDGFIWLGSTLRMIYRYDPRTGAIEEIKLPFDSSTSQAICVGKKVYLLGQTYSKLIIYDRAGKKFNEAVYPSVKPDVWFGTGLVDGRYLYLFDRGSVGVIKWDTQSDTGKVIPYPYKTVLPSAGQFVAADGAVWCQVWDYTAGQYKPQGLVRLDVKKDAFTDWCPFPAADAENKPYTDPKSTHFYPHTLKGKLFPFDFTQKRWCQAIAVPEYGQLFGFIGLGSIHNDRWYFSISTYNGTETGCDGKPYHFCNGLLEFDPKSNTFAFPTLEAKDAYFQIAYHLSAGGHLYATGNNIREKDGTLNNAKTGEALFWQTRKPAGENEPAPLKHKAIEFASTTVYHSPQTPSFTCWAGAWLMPDKSLMITCTQATGPFKDRPRTDPKILASFPGWPPNGNANYDMNGLDLSNVYLQSKDAGKTWKEVSADSFRSCMNHATGKGQVALADGTIVRVVWGQYLPFDDKAPKTGYLQRSRDGSKTWGPPESPLLDPKLFTTYPTRLRILRDGRLIVTGGLMRVPAGTLPVNVTRPPIEPLLMTSDDGGTTWTKPILVAPERDRVNWSGEEYDVAELADGDLLCVFRTVDPTRKTEKEVRWQGLLKKGGTTWTPREVGPSALGHSGHPELLATQEGVVLHIATDGIHGTADGGKSWHALDGSRASGYYPRSIQLADGRIAIFSHVGGDDAYGAVDQSILMNTFRLSEK